MTDPDFRALSKAQFVLFLVDAGWDAKEAAEEYERVASGNDGTEDDCGP